MVWVLGIFWAGGAWRRRMELDLVGFDAVWVDWEWFCLVGGELGGPEADLMRIGNVEELKIAGSRCLSLSSMTLLCSVSRWWTTSELKVYVFFNIFVGFSCSSCSKFSVFCFIVGFRALELQKYFFSSLLGALFHDLLWFGYWMFWACCGQDLFFSSVSNLSFVLWFWRWNWLLLEFVQLLNIRIEVIVEYFHCALLKRYYLIMNFRI